MRDRVRHERLVKAPTWATTCQAQHVSHEVAAKLRRWYYSLTHIERTHIMATRESIEQSDRFDTVYFVDRGYLHRSMFESSTSNALILQTFGY